MISKFKNRYLLFLLVALLVLISSSVLAHQISVSSKVQNGFIVVESSLVEAKVKVYNNNQIIKEGKTDHHGNYKFKIPNVTTDLKIELTGELGHQAQTVVAKDELITTKSNSQVKTAVKNNNLTKKELKKVIRAELKEQLAPIKEDIEQLQQGPSLTEIIGGLGYIFGLAGLFYYFKARQGGSNC